MGNDVKAQICPTCGGRGTVGNPLDQKLCPSCKGQGTVETEGCLACGGYGKILDPASTAGIPCLACEGTGRVPFGSSAPDPPESYCWFCGTRLDPAGKGVHTVVLRFGGLWILDTSACDICLSNACTLVMNIANSFRENIRKEPRKEPPGRNIVL